MNMNQTQKIQMLLEGSRLFGRFDANVIQATIPLLSTCRFEAGSLVCLKGDESDSLYLISEGQAEVSVSSRDGKIIMLGSLSPGDVFGEVGLLDGEARTANVMACTDLELYRLSSAGFAELTKMFGVKEWIALSSYICFLFRRVTNNLEETLFLDASIRVARKILVLHKESRHGSHNNFQVTISQENLGRMAGLSREATNKALSKLEDMGLIFREYKKIIVPDIAKLAMIADSEQG